MTDRAQFPDRDAAEDEFFWLEDVQSDRALAWVSEQNARTSGLFTAYALEQSSKRILDVLDSTDRIPMVSKRGAFLYNFWKDAEHPRGLWRRATLDSYMTSEPEWDLLLDVDELCRLEGAEWVFASADMLFPQYTRALIRLSPDGGDATAVREFDLETKTFVADGFNLPSAKISV
ncbi:MAG: S9 family peptidase, partial [Chloroflexota bacterium]|nr:S9 family peptidase [Chloroflexota bacterium]